MTTPARPRESSPDPRSLISSVKRASVLPCSAATCSWTIRDLMERVWGSGWGDRGAYIVTGQDALPYVYRRVRKLSSPLIACSARSRGVGVFHVSKG